MADEPRLEQTAASTLSQQWNTAKDALIDAAGAILLEGKNPIGRPERLYHFTDTAGLLGILQSRALWATLATSLNDSSEVRFGLTRALDLLESEPRDIPQPFREAVCRFIEPQNSPEAIRLLHSAYTISFCARADRAVHWLHYGKAGTGVAIGFELNDIALNRFDLFPVVYDAVLQQEIITRLATAVYRELRQRLNDIPRNEREALAQVAARTIADHLWLLAPRLKDNAFEAEDEWRLITYGLQGERVPKRPELEVNTRFRVVGQRIVPYTELQFQSLPVTEVIIGAASSMTAVDPAFQILAQKTLTRPLSISRSGVPVRP